MISSHAVPGFPHLQLQRTKFRHFDDLNDFLLSISPPPTILCIHPLMTKTGGSVPKWKQILGIDDEDGRRRSSAIMTDDEPLSARGDSPVLSPALAELSADSTSTPPSYCDLPEVVPGTGAEIITSSGSSPRSATAPKSRLSFFRRSTDARAHKTKPARSDLPEPLEFLDKQSTAAAAAAAVPDDATVHRFPRDIIFTRTGHLDFLLSPAPPAPSLKDPKPLPALPAQYHISVRESGAPPSKDKDRSLDALPDIAIHSTTAVESPLLAFAHFHSSTFATSITCLPPPPKPDSVPDAAKPYHPVYLASAPAFGNRNQGHRTIKLASTGGIFSAERYAFSHTLPRTAVLENFEWRHSSSSLIRNLAKVCNGIADTHAQSAPSSASTKSTNAGGLKISAPGTIKENTYSNGLKLVRCTTGKTVAIYAGDREGRLDDNPKKAVGMMRFLAGDEGGAGGGAGQGKAGWGLGEEFELLAIMSILCVMERGRRVMEVHRVTLGDGLV